jgi:hypothetical protein
MFKILDALFQVILRNMLHELCASKLRTQEPHCPRSNKENRIEKKKRGATTPLIAAYCAMRNTHACALMKLVRTNRTSFLAKRKTRKNAFNEITPSISRCAW